jgi:hypothetical protein
MKSVNDKVDFASAFLGAGHLNGVINVTLGTFLFTPEADPATGKEVVKSDLAISTRLRMDVATARALYEGLRNALKLAEPVAESSAATIEASPYRPLAPDGETTH